MERAEGSSPKKLRGPNRIGPLFSLHSQAQMLERDCDGEIPRDYTNYQGGSGKLWSGEAWILL
jgi:hypothetical protein